MILFFAGFGLGACSVAFALLAAFQFGRRS
jgi:hypothetical protein